MVELVLVIAVLGIVAAVAVPRLVGRNHFDTRGYVDQLAATVRFAQKLAVAQNRAVFVRLNANDATLCYDAGCTTFAPGPGGEAPYTVVAPNGVTIASAVTPLGFDAGGRPIPVLNAPLTITVNGAGAYPVVVERETGYVH